MNRIITFVKKEAVLTIAGACAVISCFFVPPSQEYLGYINFKVLCLLFSLMAVVAELTRLGFFRRVSDLLLPRCNGRKSLMLLLVGMCFFSSMLITNDVALLTFVPLALSLMSGFGNGTIMLTVALQTVAANLGSMLTPVGNPQNLILFTASGMDAGSFFALTAPITAISLGALLIIIFVQKNRALPQTGAVDTEWTEKPDTPRLIMCLLLFVLSLATVFGAVHYLITAAITLVSLLIADRKTLLKVDYCLLITFVFFFVFSGNLSAIPAVRGFIEGLLGGKEMLCAIGVSQVVSNVPAAVMLSGFTDNYRALILGTDIGGLGTLVASLASLISYKLYAARDGSTKGRYLLIFTVINVVLLALLIAAAVVIY